MSIDVICLRPEADFTRVGVTPPQNISIAYRKPDDSDLPALMKQAKAVVMPAVGPKLPAALFEGTSLKVVQITGAGVDRLDEAALKKLGIPVANVPGGSNSAVAEYVTACASVLLRRFAWADAEIKKGNYVPFRNRMMADNLAGIDGATVGVVGMGVIGMAVAQAFHRIGCNIVYFDPAPKDTGKADAMGAKALPLEDLLKTADVVTLHVPLIPATTNLIGSKQLALMKPEAVLINGARGGVVDEAALAQALQDGRIAGAAVDVYSIEPATPDNPLLQLQGEAASRLLLTPHVAGVTRQSAAFLFKASWENVQHVLNGGTVANRVY
ncbi:MAG: 3-phosphoglycerate dehydrogenase [Burkholderiales bacterium]|nr:3-phosphoglycerate dehydrogenase [Burkholderiales bacterium]